MLISKQGRNAHLILCLALIFLGLATRADAGPLLEKARNFDKNIQLYNCPDGLVFNVFLDASGTFAGVSGDGDSCIWTGAYVAAQVYRFKTTGDSEALKNIEKSLWAFHTLQAVTGCPGFLGRSFGSPGLFRHVGGKIPGIGSYSHLVFNPDTSRDQYTGLFLAYSLAWPLIQDPRLRETVKADVTAIGRNLKENHLALISEIQGKRVPQFNLNPTYVYQDRINPHEWSTVDDFPANVICGIIPFNATTAAALSTFMPPPMRGGEALRALLMMGAVASITRDPEFETYFRDEMCHRLDFIQTASETCEFLDELYRGENRVVVKRILGGLAVSFLKVSGEILSRQGLVPRVLLKLLAPGGIILAQTLGEKCGEKLSRMFERLNQPGALKILLIPARELKDTAKTLENFGAAKIARKIQAWGDWLELCSNSNMDEFSDTMRSYVGTNLTFFALLGNSVLGAEPRCAAAVKDLLRRCFRPIADEKISLYTYIRAGYGDGPLPPSVMADARETLLEYPENQMGRVCDHSSDPGLRTLPWPDRFGHYGTHADHLFSVKDRAPHIFIWQETPREVKSACDPRELTAPVGYLFAYWLGRYHGFLTEKD